MRREQARRAAAEVERLDPVCGGEGYDARTFCRSGLGNRGLVRSGGRGRGCSGIRRAPGVLRPGTAPLYLPLVPVRRAAPREVPCGARAMCRRKSRSNGSDFCKKGYGCRRLPCFSEWIFGAGRCLYRNCNGLFAVAGPGTRLFFAGLSCGRRNPGHRFCRKKPTFAGRYPCAGSGFACAECGYGLSACRSPVGAVSHRRQVRPGVWLKAAARNGSSAELQR